MKESALLFVITLAGGFVPLLFRLTDRFLHAALALATGVFMGAVFLHLLPALAEFDGNDHREATAETAVHAPARDGQTAPDAPGLGRDAAHVDAHKHSGGTMVIWMFVLIGVLAVYLLEALAFRTHDHDELHRHKAVSYAALSGLSVHALTAGVGYSAVAGNAGLSGPVLLALIAHKAFESFSLTTVFALAQTKRNKIVAIILLFALVTPFGIVLGNTLTSVMSNFGIAIFTALAAGTFLYVCLCELLPEVFHHREDSIAKIALLLLGIAVMALLHELGI